MTTTLDLLAELRWRGLVAMASDGLEARLARGPISGYIGFDASATSLHVGHLLQVFLLTHLQRAGGRPVVVIGGGTGMIGDPSGKSNERRMLDDAAIEANAAALRGQLERFVDFAPGPTQARMVDNREWLLRTSVITFLRDVGRHFTVPYMLAKDSVQARLTSGMSFTEFSYMTLQAADFLHLHRDLGVDLQMGGADQWGNISAGLELIRRVEGHGEGTTDEAAAEPTAFGLCSPLLLTRSGQKMGKSERGAVFLDPALTSPFDFYQYWLNDDDALVGDHLRWLTLLEREAVEAVVGDHAARPESRVAQHALARDLTARVHGATEAERQARLAEAAFSGSVSDPETLEALHAALGGFDAGPEARSWTCLDLAVAAAGNGSRSDARRLISQGGLSVNGKRVVDPAAPAPPPIAGRWWWVALGRKRRVVGRVLVSEAG